jgi:D-alanyl-D-alanine carboxypeptidase
MRNRAFYLLLVCLIASACGGVESPRIAKDQRPGAAPTLDLPPLARTIPAFIVFSPTPFEQETLGVVNGTKGVSAVAAASIKQVPVSGPAGTASLRVAAVDPLDFRSVAPASTRDAEFVWTEMASGEAILTFGAADTLDMSEGDGVTVADRSLTVGAFAENGLPNIAEVLINEEVGAGLRLGGPQWLIVGASPSANTSALRKALDEQLPDARIAGLLPDPPDLLAADDPEQVGEATGSLIGTMTFKILDDGFIKPNKDWVQQNIATSTVPIIGEVTCHHLVIPQLSAALNEIAEAGLAELIRADDYGGCYVPRFIDRDPSLPLSMHAFGLAADINVSTNLLGSEGDQDPRVVEIFEKWGFEWGGYWDRPDPMHFELARIVET